MEKESIFSGFVTRHAQSAKHDTPDEVYKSLTPKGVEQAKERANSDILRLIEEAPDGAVMFIGGGSDQPRSEETAEIYGGEINHLVNYELKDKLNIQVVTRDFIKWAIDPGEASAEEKQKNLELMLQRIEEMIKENPGKKFVVDYPMRLWGFSYGYRSRDENGKLDGEPRWLDPETGKASKFFATIIKEKGNNEGGQAYIAGNGEYIDQSGKTLHGPKPQDIARQYFNGLEKLSKFAARHTDRPLILGGVGHAWDVDSLATWLSLGCPEVEVDSDKFNERFLEISQGGEISNESEMVSFEIEPEQIKVRYRGKEFSSSLIR
ncbi:MAG: hypothetical protein WCW26_04750 [Candidatus Buchananbacteria bacterium]